VSKTTVLELLHLPSFTVNRRLVIGDASQHLPKFFCQSFAAAFSPNFFTTKVSYLTVFIFIIKNFHVF